MFFPTNPQRSLRKRLCDRDIHWTFNIKTLVGGEGPDDAGWIVECSWCHRQGWKYCNGDVSMSDTPIVDRGTYRTPDSSATVVATLPSKRLPTRIRVPFFLGIFHILMAFVWVFLRAWSSAITSIFTSLLLFILVSLIHKDLSRTERDDDKPNE